MLKHVVDNKIDHVVLLGDIWHTKTQLISPEYIDFLTWMLRAFAEHADVHITLGNHDGQLNNDQRQDAVSPVVNAIAHPRIKLYKDSGVYPIQDGYNLCVFSLFDEKNWSDVEPITGEINIACYHGPVLGAKLDNDWNVEHGMSLDFFSDYDFTLLGDLHSLQYLDERDTINGKRPYIAYPGSTLQQTYGENVRNHGFLCWNIRDRNDFDVEFTEITNRKPFATVDWNTNVETTLVEANKFPKGSRIRIRATEKLSQRSLYDLRHALNTELEPAEIVFKDEFVTDQTKVVAKTKTLEKNDLRSEDVLFSLLQEHHKDVKLEPHEWSEAYDLVKRYAHISNENALPQNTSWNMKRLEFDNMFTYGTGNVINFEKMSGLVGLLGRNRIGKSSVPGTLLYALFNTTDRGNVKNIDICNSRADECYAKLTFNVGGTDYAIHRQTSKWENKSGNAGAATTLKFDQMSHGGEMLSLVGEQRADTEKEVRSLIGNADDFMMTSMSVQGGVSNFIDQGATQRRKIVSRFLGIDAMHRIHDAANKSITSEKTLLKRFGDTNHDEARIVKEKELADVNLNLLNYSTELKKLKAEFATAQSDLAKHSGISIVTKDQVKEQEGNVRKLKFKIEENTNLNIRHEKMCVDLQEKINKIELALTPFNTAELRLRLSDVQKASAKIDAISQLHVSEEKLVAKNKRSLEILKKVPCGDSFPTCMFIKDAHELKSGFVAQEQRLVELKQQLEEAQKTLKSLDEKSLTETLKKVEALEKKKIELEKKFDNEKLVILGANNELTSATEKIVAEEKKLTALQDAFLNSENEGAATLKLLVAELEEKIEEIDRNRIYAASAQGRLETEIKNLASDQNEKNLILHRMKVIDLLIDGFSRKGIPSTIVASLLPAINEQVSRILQSITNFTVELESDGSDNIEIYINYGDSRRIIELGSGMEKTIASIALRVALANVSMMPRPDIFIIDEGFGVFDDIEIDTCCKLLTSLKEYFRTVLVITHVDKIKGIIDQIIEIEREDGNSKIVYE
jgi:DNA repair exonuclease SbcCD ATPase subunit